MKNPYTILELPQNANNAQILKAMPLAMRKRLYPNTEIAQASSVLRKPSTRLAADFTFPVFDPFDDMEPLQAKINPEVIDIKSIDENKYNSL
jgi:hypothetical protein